MSNIRIKFVEEMANPHAWLVTADNLHEQALSLHATRGKGMLIFARESAPNLSWDLTDRSVFLLGGFALENAIKAFLVYENPQWISNGRLARKLQTHSLTQLQMQSKCVPLKKKSLWVLREFEAGLESWARYPCGLSAETSRHPSVLREKLWLGYLQTMKAYGQRLKLLLRKGWHGPDGFDGRWTFDAEFLSSQLVHAL